MDAQKPDSQQDGTKAADLPVIKPPVERKSDKLSFMGYAKSVVLVVVVTKLAALAGYLVGRNIPESSIPKQIAKYFPKEGISLVSGKKTRPFAALMAGVGGTAGGIYEAWKRWGKVKGQELTVKDIHADFYQQLDPRQLQAEVEQNQRIQDGLTRLVQPRGSFTQEASKEEPAATLTR
jgi:hypothetical protein